MRLQFLPSDTYQVPHPSVPSSSISRSPPTLFDSRMSPQSLDSDVVGNHYEWTVTIKFSGKLEVNNNVNTRSTVTAVAICQNIATALEPYLPPNTLFHFPGSVMVPRWKRDNTIQFKYFVQLGLPSTFEQKFGSGSGKVQKTWGSTLYTTISPTKDVPANIPALLINTYQVSPTNPPNHYLLFDSQMIPQSPATVGVNVWIVTIDFDKLPGFVADSEDTRYDAVYIRKKIATALQPYLPEKNLFYFAGQGLVPHWDEENEIRFNYFLQQGLPLRPMSRKERLYYYGSGEKRSGSGEVKKMQSYTLKTTIHPEEESAPPAMLDTHQTSQTTSESSSTSTSPDVYLVDSHMNFHSPDSVGVDYQTISVMFRYKDQTDFKAQAQAHDIYRNIVTELALQLPPHTLFYFLANDLVLCWNAQNEVTFELYLNPGRLSTSGYGGLVYFGAGKVKKGPMSTLKTSFTIKEPMNLWSKGTSSRTADVNDHSKDKNFDLGSEKNPDPMSKHQTNFFPRTIQTINLAHSEQRKRDFPKNLQSSVQPCMISSFILQLDANSRDSDEAKKGLDSRA
ncbi:hypothetical protein EV360DRAFT_76084 [Lentinula raphanica]|nr:hypothetical protein EV360DRAFT_76084 [Lentinula raphanica]